MPIPPPDVTASAMLRRRDFAQRDLDPGMIPAKGCQEGREQSAAPVSAMSR